MLFRSVSRGQGSKQLRQSRWKPAQESGLWLGVVHCWAFRICLLPQLLQGGSGSQQHSDHDGDDKGHDCADEIPCQRKAFAKDLDLQGYGEDAYHGQ